MERGEKRNVGATVARISQSYWPVFTLFGAFLAFLLTMNRIGINTYDEGLALLGAQNVLQGQIPYRDFWTIYPPGGLYFDAALFQVFGSSIFVARMANSIITFLAVVCIFLITQHITARKYAVVSSILVIGALMQQGVGVSQAWVFPALDALLLALVACIYLFHLRTYDGTRDVLVLGLITAFSALFRLEAGLFLFVALSAILTLCNYSGAMSVSWPKGRLYKVVKVWGIYVSGILIIALPVMILILRAVPLQDLVDIFIVFPRSIYPAFRSLPPPSLFYGDAALRAFFYLPICVYLASFLWLGAQLIRHKTKLIEQSKPLFLLVLGVLFFTYGSVRVTRGHLAPTFIISAILFSWLVFSFVEEVRRTLKRRPIQAVRSAVNLTYLFAVMLVVLLLLSPTFSALNPAQRVLGGGSTGLVALDMNPGRGTYENAAEARNLADAVAFIQAHVPKNQTIFVGNTQHERILLNNVILYFLAERASATKYYDLHPGVATTAEVQNRIINDIAAHDTKYVVLCSAGYTVSSEPNQSRYPSGVKNLDNFIRANFVPVKRYGEFTIYARNDVFAKSRV